MKTASVRLHSYHPTNSIESSEECLFKTYAALVSY